MTVLQQENFEGQPAIGQPYQGPGAIFTSSLGTPTIVAGLAGTGKAVNINPATTGHLVNDGWSAPKALMRKVFRFSALPSGSMVIAHAYSGPVATGVRIGDVRLLANGLLEIRSGFSNVDTAVNALSPNTDYAIEWLIDTATDTQWLRIYTDLDNVAVPIEELTGAIPGTAANVTQFQIGKMTNVAWTGGITVDEYIRADDWYATSVAAAFDEHFAGPAVAANFVATSEVPTIVGPAPVIAAGGVHTDQKHIQYAALNLTDREIVAKTFPSGTTQTWERVYFRVPAAGQFAEATAVWRATGTGGATSFTVVVQRNSASSVNVQLWEADTWDQGAITGEIPLDVVNNVPITTWGRLEIQLLQDPTTLDFSIVVDVYMGNAKHLTGQANRLGRLSGLTSLGGIRVRRLGSRGMAGVSTDRMAIWFDEWEGSTTGPVGALPLAQQFDPPVGQQFAFYEWTGTTETPLTLEGVTIGDADTPTPTFRVKDGLFLKDGIQFVPHGFVMMAVSMPIGSEGAGGPGVNAWTNWVDHGTEMMAALKDEWHVDTLRIQLGQAGIDPSGSNYSQAYVDRVLAFVSTLRDNGFITILSMQDWDPVDGELHKLPTAHTQRAWAKIMPTINAWSFAKRSGVAAEIFNEPWIDDTNDPVTPSANDWSQWRNGGHPSGTITQAENQGALAIGHQQMVDYIRGLGFNGVIVADSLDKGHTLSGITPLTDTLTNPNIAYAIHTQHFHGDGNTTTQDRTQIWEPRWLNPRDLHDLAVTATEWSLRREVDEGDTNNLKAVTPDYLDWMRDNKFGIQPWAFDTDAGGDFAYIIAHSGANAYEPNDWDAWDPLGAPANTGAGELLFARYPTWDGEPEVEPLEIGATTVAGEIVDPDPDPDPDPTEGRFSGDPGEGKIYLGWNSQNSGWQFHYGLLDDLRGASVPGYPAKADLAEGYYRAFYVLGRDNNDSRGQEYGVNQFGSHTSSTWPELRNACANVDIINVTYDSEPTGTAEGQQVQGERVISGFYDPMWEQLALHIIEMHERHGSYVHVNFANEPDSTQNSDHWASPYNMRLLRRCHRYLHFKLLAEGVPRNLFEVTTPVIFNQTAYDSQNRFNGGNRAKVAERTWGGTRGDGIWQYHPDWKESITIAGGRWNTAWNPNPDDFLLDPNEMDQWGYGRGPIIRVLAINSYCPDAWDGAFGNWSVDTFRTHTVEQDGHGGRFFDFFEALYGRTFPTSINEWGYPIRHTGTTDADVNLVETADQMQRHMDVFKRHAVFGMNKWRHETTFGPIGFFRRRANPNTSGSSNINDPTNGYVKQMASGWHHPDVINPKYRGTYSTVKPLASQSHAN